MPGSAIDDAVTRAVAAVPFAHYADRRTPGGVRTAIALPAVERDLRRAGIAPGMRVLEVGVGSGYTGAVLATLVGQHGHVVSVDTDGFLVERAGALHARLRIANLTLLCADGYRGVPEYAPYDAVVGWAAPTLIPAGWVAQARPGAVISTPAYIAPVARMVAHVRVVVQVGGAVADLRLGPADVDMRERVAGADVPAHFVDAREEGNGGAAAWLSTAWRGQYPGHDPATTLHLLRGAQYTEPVELGPTPEDRAVAWRDFCAYCVGRDLSNLTAYGVTGQGQMAGIGYSSGKNAAVLTVGGQYVANGLDSPALMKLRDFFRQWEETNRPGIEALKPIPRATGAGWQVHTTPVRLATRRGRTVGP